MVCSNSLQKTVIIKKFIRFLDSSYPILGIDDINQYIKILIKAHHHFKHLTKLLMSTTQSSFLSIVEAGAYSYQVSFNF